MITKEDLNSIGFNFSEYYEDFRNDNYPNYGFYLEDNKIDYVRHYDNFHGLPVSIDSITRLQIFLTFI